MGRAPCCDKANVKRGPWSPDEDAILKTYIDNHGTGGNWITLPQRAGLRRCGKSCRLRWLNYLRPDIKHGCFTEEEDNIICSLYLSIGSRWSVIASNLPGRTDNDVKNYWNTRLKKKLLGVGIIHPNSTKLANISSNNSSTRGNSNNCRSRSASLLANLSAALPPLPHSSRFYQETNFVSPSPSLPSLTEVSDNTSTIAGSNIDFHVSSTQELSSSSGSSSVATKESYFNLSIDDLLDLDFGAVYEILSNGCGFDQETSSHLGPYMI